MRFGCLVLAGVMAAPVVAQADVYDFLYQQTQPDYGCTGFSLPYCPQEVIEFHLSTPVVPESYGDGYFDVDPVLLHGPASGAVAPLKFEQIPQGPSAISFSAVGELYALLYYQDFSQLLFTGPTSSPTLVIGSGAAQTFEVENGVQGGYSTGSTGVLTVTDLSTVATPEPSTLALLGTGVLGAGGVVRRRLARA